MNQYRKIILDGVASKRKAIKDVSDKALANLTKQRCTMDTFLADARAAFNGLRLVVSGGDATSEGQVGSYYLSIEPIGSYSCPAARLVGRRDGVGDESPSVAVVVADFVVTSNCGLRVTRGNLRMVRESFHPDWRDSLRTFAEWFGDNYEVLPPEPAVTVDAEAVRVLLKVADWGVRHSISPEPGLVDAVDRVKAALAAAESSKGAT